MAATTMPINNVSSSKAAEIYRENSGKIFYVCFHCGFDSDNITDTLKHIDIHFSSQDDIRTVEHLDFVNIKCELPDENSLELVDSNRLEQIFINCDTKPELNAGQCIKMDTCSDGVDQPTLSVTDDSFTDLEGLFEWKCLHCESLFKKCAKFKQHLLKHSNDLPHCVENEMSSNETKRETIRAHYAFKCTLCSSEFYDPISSEQHLTDYHAAADPPVKRTSRSKELLPTDLKKSQMKTVRSDAEKKATIQAVPNETKQRNETPAEANREQCECTLCNKLLIGTLEFMQHTFGHFDLKIFSCRECPTKFQRMTTFNEHMKKKHRLKVEYNFYCRFCDDNVDHLNLFDFVTHAFAHHLDDGDRNNFSLDTIFNYHCRFCFKQFNKWNDARTHMTNHAKDELATGIPSAATTNGRSYTERAMSGTYRSEFLYNCFSCTSTLCGSYEARKHWVMAHKPPTDPVHCRVLLAKKNHEKGSFKCSDCDKSFDTLHFLMRHRLMHFNIQPYPCTVCSRSFSSTSHLTRHVTKDHSMKQNLHRQLICKFCQAEFTEDGDFITHNFKVHLYENFTLDENLDELCKYECLYCSEVIMERDLMDQHLQKHKGEAIPGTMVAQATGSDESSINGLRHKMEFMYVCVRCSKKFRLPIVASEHVKFVHKAEIVDKSKTERHCLQCNIMFRTWRSLINHRAQMHPEMITRDPARQYKKKASQTNTRKKKRRTPEGTHCNICNITFLTNRSMINHRTKRHPETVQPPRNNHLVTYSCAFCDKTFRDRSNFSNHTETHTKRHSFTCDICNKTYRLKNSLQTHMLIHTNEKNFVCEECGKSFYTTSKLNLHKQVHENLTIQCEKCDKVFYTRNNFSKHKKTHIDNVRKKCEVCGNTFKSTVSLRVHMLLHDGTKKHACRYCDMTFAQSSGRRGHEKTRHGFV